MVSSSIYNIILSLLLLYTVYDISHACNGGSENRISGRLCTVEEITGNESKCNRCQYFSFRRRSDCHKQMVFWRAFERQTSPTSIPPITLFVGFVQCPCFYFATSLSLLSLCLFRPLSISVYPADSTRALPAETQW